MIGWFAVFWSKTIRPNDIWPKYCFSQYRTTKSLFILSVSTKCLEAKWFLAKIHLAKCVSTKSHLAKCVSTKYHFAKCVSTKSHLAKSSFGPMILDQKSFGQMCFDQKLFGQMILDQKPWNQMTEGSQLLKVLTKVEVSNLKHHFLFKTYII